MAALMEIRQSSRSHHLKGRQSLMGLLFSNQQPLQLLKGANVSPKIKAAAGKMAAFIAFLKEAFK